MLNKIQVALACFAILVATIDARQTSPPKFDVVLENAYVKVTVEPPVPALPNEKRKCFSFTELPLVSLAEIDPQLGTAEQAKSSTVVAGYFAPNSYFWCPSIHEGNQIYIELKSIPDKSAFGDDAVRIDAAHNEVVSETKSTHNTALLENDRVRVVHVHFEAGESGPMVDKRPRVIFAVTGSHATVTFPDGHSETRDMKAGTVSFGNAGRQATKNTGTTPLENIVVELKSKDSEKK